MRCAISLSLCANEVAGEPDAGAIHQDVHVVAALGEMRVDRLRRVGARHVERDRQGGDREFQLYRRSGRLQGAGMARHEHHVWPPSREPPGELQAYPAIPR